MQIPQSSGCGQFVKKNPALGWTFRQTEAGSRCFLPVYIKTTPPTYSYYPASDPATYGSTIHRDLHLRMPLNVTQRFHVHAILNCSGSECMTQSMEVCMFHPSRCQQVVECVTHRVRFDKGSQWHRKDVTVVLIDFCIAGLLLILCRLVLHQHSKHIIRNRDYTETAAMIVISCHEDSGTEI